MFFLSYKHTNDCVFDYFPKISDHFLKILEDYPKLFRKVSRTSLSIVQKLPLTMSKDFRRLPKTFKEDPKMSRSYTSEFKYS